MASESPTPRFSVGCLSTIGRQLVLASVLGLCLASPPARAQFDANANPEAAAAATTQFNAAISAFDHGDFQNAFEKSDGLIKQVPTDLPPADAAKVRSLMEPMYYTRGAAAFNLRKYPEAMAALQEYLVHYPKGARVPEVMFSLGEASYLGKDYTTAASTFAKLEFTPAFREQALLFEGLSYKETGENAKGIAALEKLVTNGIKSPMAARGGLQLVLLYSRSKQPEKALKTLSDVQANVNQLENVVELNAIALEQGDAYLESNANKEALTCYRVVRSREQVIAIERDRIVGLQRRLEANRAAARANPKDVSQYFFANKQLQDSITEDQGLIADQEKQPPIYPKVLYRIARVCAQAGRPWEAAAAYQDSLDRSQDPADREPALYGLITANADVNQPAAGRAACNQYLKEFPEGANASTVGYLLGATALQENDPKAAESYFGRMLAEQPASTMREEMSFLLCNAKFAQGKYDEARAGYVKYGKDFPQGTHFEESVYRTALADLFDGKYEDALKGVEDYLKKYPSGNFVSDAKYRRDVCKYAMNKYDEVIADTQAWIKQYPGDAQQGEVEALLADAFVATGKDDDALAGYQVSVKTAATDEVLNYSLIAAAKILQKRGDWAADDALFTDFVTAHPDHQSVVMALSQIGRAKTKEGKPDEAKRFLADTLKKYIDDPQRDSVEQILDQLAGLCVKKKAPAAIVPLVASPSPGPAEPAAGSLAPDAVVAAVASPTPEPDPNAELDDLLGASRADRTPTAQARILYAKAQLARLRRQPAEADRDLLTIAAKFKPAALSATLLGLIGDTLLSKGKLDEAGPFYQTLMDDYPKSDDVDFAYAGLGEIAFQKNQYEKALDFFRDGSDKITPNQKLKELTVGEAKTLLALGKFDEAKKLFGQAASVREWRGDTTAFCVYSLGQIEAKQGHWAEANVYYQRVFVAYQRFLPWVAKAYLGSADSLEKLGKKEDAVKIYQEMLSNPKLADLTEANEARQRLQALGGS